MTRKALYISNFKKTLILILFIAAFASASVGVGEFYESIAAKNKVNLWSEQRFSDFYALERNSIDIAFLGSSHSYCTFDPEKLEDTLGMTCYQLGMPGQLPDATYYTLLELLNYQNPKCVVVELYWELTDKEFDMKQAEALFRALKNEELQKDYFKNVVPPGEKLSYMIKPVRYQRDVFAWAETRFWSVAEEKLGVKRRVPEGVEYYRSKGYIYCDYVMGEDEYVKISNEKGLDGAQWRIAGAQEKYLRMIAELCGERRIKLAFVTAPVSNVYLSGVERYDAIYDAARSLADECGAPYLDFNQVNAQKNVFEDKRFRDARHLNDSGSTVACAYFAEWLKNILVE
ncbi:MAG: hypothetical protein LBL35_03555 [Clostridiales bacterium]|jgi:hypothetical protein|nr:hypothetical protein [Clostridiales bacterium]